jgi:hypothetical protein
LTLAPELYRGLTDSVALSSVLDPREVQADVLESQLRQGVGDDPLGVSEQEW